MIVFLDTNILFSAILFPGSNPDKVIQKCLISDDYTVAVSDYCINELKTKFIKKFPSKESSLKMFLNVLLEQVIFVKVSNNILEEESRIRDYKDRPVYRGAVECGADILVSGDKDLLEAPIGFPKIMSASNFLENY